MKYHTINTSEAVHNVITKLADRDGRSKGSIVAEAIKLYVNTYKVPREHTPSKAGRPKIKL